MNFNLGGLVFFITGIQSILESPSISREFKQLKRRILF